MNQFEVDQARKALEAQQAIKDLSLIVAEGLEGPIESLRRNFQACAFEDIDDLTASITALLQAKLRLEALGNRKETDGQD